MYWKFDSRKFALHQLPPVLRTKGIYALLKCVMAGLDYIYALFSGYRASVDQQLNHNGTVLSLEEFLNAKFSLSDEIYIIDFKNANTYLHKADEVEPDVYVGYQGEEDPLMLSSDAPDVVSGGFTIRIPEGLSTPENIALLTKWVEFYRPAGTIYKIETYE